MSDRCVVYAGRVASSPPLEDAGVVFEGKHLIAVGTRAALSEPAKGARLLLDAPDAVITPGLVDAHTHLAYAGSRHDEYALKLKGAGYEAIAAAGGGIASTMRAVRAVSRDDLAEVLVRRLRRMARLGVTTVEVKSGYGLDEANEMKQLEAIAVARATPGVPDVVPTFLGLHAVPPESTHERDAYVRRVTTRTLPAIAAAGLASFVDAYVDRSAFTVQEAELLLAAAETHGLACRLHVGQFADVGGAGLAARFRARSVDHMEHATAESLEY